MPGFLWIAPYVVFPFAGFALFGFAIINHVHESDHMLSSVNPSESLNLWVVLGIYNTVIRGVSKHSAATFSFIGLPVFNTNLGRGKKVTAKNQRSKQLWQPTRMERQKV